VVHSHTGEDAHHPPNTTRRLQVRSLAAILPTIDVVENDGYNSSPTNVAEMGPDARIR
jgi:Mg-chelatase subunit ChlI